MFHAATNHKCATRMDVERLPLAGDPKMTVYDVHDLIVRMAVDGPNPASNHFMLG